MVTCSPTAEANLGLVYHCARHFAGCGTALEDLVQEGCLGLLQAVKRFDPTRGTAFSSFAVPFIRGRCLNAVKRNLRDRIIYLDPEMIDKLFATGRSSTGFPHHDFLSADADDRSHRAAQPDQPPDDQAAEWILSLADRLDPKAPRVMALWLGLNGSPPLDCTQIGRKIGRTKQRVHQILSDALLLLKDKLQGEYGGS